MIYIASPYSDPDCMVEQARYEAVCRYAAKLCNDGFAVFSPIAHSHPIAACGVRPDYPWLECLDLPILATCQELRVCMLPGWRSSAGVNREIGFANARRILAVYDEWPLEPQGGR